MLDNKFIYKNINILSSNLKKKNFKLKKNYFKNIFIKKNNIINKIININKNKNISLKKIKNINYLIEILFINKFIKIYKIFLNKIKKKFIYFIKKIPNITHYTVSQNKNLSNNIIIKNLGKIKKFKFITKNHINLGEKKGIDFKIGNKLSGIGFTIIKPPISYLYNAIIKFMMDTHIKEHNYKEIHIPYIVNEKTLFGSGQLPKFKNKIFKIKNKNNIHYLISTSEIPLVNSIKNSIINSKFLPIKLTSFSVCFRKESKAYGKINNGLIRQNQFDKIELINITDKKNSYRYLNEIIKHAEKLLIKLKLPYRIVLLCSKKTGITSTKTYDIEVWIPSIKKYIEVSSCSNTETYQSLRIKAKYKNKNNINFLHILNGSGLAIGRTLIGIIENYQNKNGDIRIPTILQKYMNNKKFI